MPASVHSLFLQNDALSSSSTPRIAVLDSLRAIALFGILAVNIWGFADPYFELGIKNPDYADGLGRVVTTLSVLLFETKFYLLFSLLFGYSFALQMRSMERNQRPFVGAMLRRSLGLFCIGTIVGFTLWYGEILLLYAVLMLGLLGWRHLAPRTLVIVGVALLVVNALAWCALGIIAGFEASSDDRALVLLLANAKTTAFSATATDTLQFMVQQRLKTLGILFLIQGPNAFALFLLGLAAGKMHSAQRVVSGALLGQILPLTLPVGLLGACAYAATARTGASVSLELFGFALGQLTAPLLTITLAIVWMWMAPQKYGQMVHAMLAPAGKMALSNYVGQSIILAVLFTAYGFRLINVLHPATIALVVCLVFVIQIILSRLYLRYFVYGPLEWWLRWITSGKRPALYK